MPSATSTPAPAPTPGAAPAPAEPKIPRTHKAVVYDREGALSSRVVEVGTPEVGSGEVLVHLTHSGVCHTDVSLMTGGWGARAKMLPEAGRIGGHEGVGIVVKVGKRDTLEGSGDEVEVGDRVGVKWVRGVCSRCVACLEGKEGNCSKASLSGFTSPGTFQQYVVSPANYVTPIPDGVDSAAAAPLLCAGITTYAALRRSNVLSGQWVVISGAGGGLGHLACQIASRGMAMRVIGIDHGSKRDIVMDCGAEAFVDFGKHDDDASLVEEVLTITGGLGAHGAVVCAASNRAYGQVLQYLRFGGTMVCVGSPEGEALPIANCIPGLMIQKQLTVAGVMVGSRIQAMEVMDLAARGIIKPRYRLEKMDRLTEVCRELAEGKTAGRVVLDLQ